MKIIIAPQVFKGTLSALEVAHAMKKGVKQVFPEAQTQLLPVADGGDGTLDILLHCTDGQAKYSEVDGALGKKINAKWGYIPRNETAIIEMAQVCGLSLLPSAQRNPMITSTYGLGELIIKAIDEGFKKFIIGLGGSSTNDGGAGMLQALGIRLCDRQGLDLPRGGQELTLLHHIDDRNLDSRLEACSLLIACDVSNPLLGSQGCTYTYARQKGATSFMIQELEKGLSNFAEKIKALKDIDVRHLPYCGSAGGTAAACFAFLNGQLCTGIDLILDYINFDSHVKNADLVITGEGRLDNQTTFNKAVVGVARHAKKYGVPVIAVVGSLGEGYNQVLQEGISRVFPLTFASTPSESDLQDTYNKISIATGQALRKHLKGTLLQ